MNLGGRHDCRCGIEPNPSPPMFSRYLLRSLECVCFEENERRIQNVWVCRIRDVNVLIIEPLSSLLFCMDGLRRVLYRYPLLISYFNFNMNHIWHSRWKVQILGGDSNSMSVKLGLSNQRKNVD
jgi:hypothetical protein